MLIIYFTVLLCARARVCVCRLCHSKRRWAEIVRRNGFHSAAPGRGIPVQLHGPGTGSRRRLLSVGHHGQTRSEDKTDLDGLLDRISLQGGKHSAGRRRRLGGKSAEASRILSPVRHRYRAGQIEETQHLRGKYARVRRLHFDRQFSLDRTYRPGPDRLVRQFHHKILR